MINAGQATHQQAPLKQRQARVSRLSDQRVTEQPDFPAMVVFHRFDPPESKALRSTASTPQGAGGRGHLVLASNIPPLAADTQAHT
ncbi:MAG: hypothetical protein ACRDYC_09515, partial [Acidimicrobiales bacterium]